MVISGSDVKFDICYVLNFQLYIILRISVLFSKMEECNLKAAKGQETQRQGEKDARR